MRFSKLHHHEREEPGREQDDRLPLVHRVHGARRARSSSIAPEYGAAVHQGRLLDPVRPATDAALLLGVTRLMMDNQWYDADFVKQFTDFPLLVRTDTLKRLRAARGLPRLPADAARDGAELQGPGPDRRAARQARRLRGLGRDSQVAPRRHHPRRRRREAGRSGHRPDLEWTGKVTTGRRQRGRGARPLWSAVPGPPRRTTTWTRVAEITGAPKDLIEQLAQDIATIKPCCHPSGRGHQPLVPRHRCQPRRPTCR